MARIALGFGPAEMFLLALMGVSIISNVVGKDSKKGLLVGALGFLVAAMPADPFYGLPRMNFGVLELYDQMPLIPVLIGLFAIPTFLSLSKSKYIVEVSRDVLWRVDLIDPVLYGCGRFEHLVVVPRVRHVALHGLMVRDDVNDVADLDAGHTDPQDLAVGIVDIRGYLAAIDHDLALLLDIHGHNRPVRPDEFQQRHRYPVVGQQELERNILLFPPALLGEHFRVVVRPCDPRAIRLIAAQGELIDLNEIGVRLFPGRHLVRGLEDLLAVKNPLRVVFVKLRRNSRAQTRDDY